jgi:hypothetical protein
MIFTWQPLPLTFGIQQTCRVNGYTITTYKNPKTKLYSFEVADSAKNGRCVYDSAADPWCEQTSNPHRIRDLAEMWIARRMEGIK